MRTTVARSSRELTLRAFLESDPPLDVRIDVAKRLLTAIARMHESARVHARLDADSVRLSGVRSFRITLTGVNGVESVTVDEAPASGSRDTRYSPPEGEASLRGDVFALGAMLTEMLPDATPAVASVLHVMRQRDPQARYASAQVAMCAFARAT